jgi:hypothetical protein
MAIRQDLDHVRLRMKGVELHVGQDVHCSHAILTALQAAVPAVYLWRHVQLVCEHAGHRCSLSPTLSAPQAKDQQLHVAQGHCVTWTSDLACPRQTLCDSLVKVDLGRAWIGSEGGGSLAHALRGCRAIAHLNLESNGIGDLGVGKVAAALAGCGNLRVLALARNQIAAEGARSLAAALLHWPRLQRLALASNLLTAEGVHALALRLPDCTPPLSPTAVRWWGRGCVCSFSLPPTLHPSLPASPSPCLSSLSLRRRHGG